MLFMVSAFENNKEIIPFTPYEVIFFNRIQKIFLYFLDYFNLRQ